MTKSLKNRLSQLKPALLAVAAAFSLHAHASTFTLESTTVIFDEREQRVAFNVKNDGESPILLVSKLEDLEADSKISQRILIAPPIARIDPGQSQQVNYALKKGTKLGREYLLKASFEGIAQQGKGSMVMPIRQEIGFIVQPSSVPHTKTPWQSLKLVADGKQLTVSNPSPHVVRLVPELTVMPSGKVATLDHPYLMPGESHTLDIEGSPEQVKITPLSRYGLVQQPVDLPVTR
ncbi:fimbria/pilus chaperone family protein [Burkholderia ambifaria]|uniref:fimbria/pilus chaperone family protein n=1 Tax=Burkholderia ambifaria TaxID=152480 RepID=UPI00159055BF|nr:fimbria/pilus chaperone family protein [Burkholderia ambifaria]